MSDIFNSYAEIMADKGLVKIAQKDKEPKTRPQGIDLEAIEMLYGVKPNGDEDHIVEQAHPEPVVVAPAYDRFNGLVENVIERQNMMAEIALKPNDGKLTHHRYIKANDELLNEVLKTAFLLDSRGHEDLMRLSDSCADRITKEAITGLAIAGIVAAGLAIFGLVNNWGGKLDTGVQDNANRAIEEIQDIVNDSDVMPGQEAVLSTLIEHISAVSDLHGEISSLNISVEESTEGRPGVKKEEIAQGKALLAKYTKAATLLSKEIGHVLARMQKPGGTSWVSEYLGDYGVAVEKGWDMLWGDEVNDAVQILGTLQQSVRESIVNMSKYYRAVKDYASKGATSELEELLGTDVVTPKTEKVKEEEPEKVKEEKSEMDLLTEQLMS
jgi:hypothetical protein